MSQNSMKKFGFTLIELLVVISIIALLLGILVPVLGIAKKNANIMKESVNIRNMNLGMNTYGGTNKDWFPGLNSSGKYSTANFAGEYYFASSTNVTDVSNATGANVDSNNNLALAILLEEGQCAPAQLVSPGENGANSSTTPFAFTPATPDTIQGTPAASGAATGEVTNVNSSYSLLQYYSATLKSEWKGNQNQQAIVCGARLIFTDGAAPAADKFSTVWTDSQSAKYKGAIAHGDNSTNTESFNKGDITAAPTYFANLKYGSKVFSPNATSGTQVAIFGFHTATANYGGTSNLGQLGSVED